MINAQINNILVQYGLPIRITPAQQQRLLQQAQQIGQAAGQALQGPFGQLLAEANPFNQAGIYNIPADLLFAQFGIGNAAGQQPVAAQPVPVQMQAAPAAPAAQPLLAPQPAPAAPGGPAFLPDNNN